VWVDKICHSLDTELDLKDHNLVSIDWSRNRFLIMFANFPGMYQLLTSVFMDLLFDVC